ncbi:MAG: sulfatase-like hydrolase/transferase [Kiritimatiellae bacterium]|jgi:arylsulfatase|nr:sulfatase-like hydrolase/transferase [Kiritimatiellia bacterium]
MKKPKNVIWITTDHMRYDCIGANGNSVIHTPNLDRLTNEGVSFSDCYGQNPLCMPSRCSFMTGCYPQQTGVMCNRHELADDFLSTPGRVFGVGGYRTTQIGKLHFQHHEDHDLGASPTRMYGFERFYRSEEPCCYEDAYRTWLRGEYPEYVKTFTLPRPMSLERHDEAVTYTVLDAPWQCSHSGWVSLQFERTLAAWGLRGGKQFFHLGLYAPHPPLNPTKEMMDPYSEIPDEAFDDFIWAGADEDFRHSDKMTKEKLMDRQRHFYAMVTGVDMAVGRVLDVLEQNGELDDTLIIFGSDHGDACGDHGAISKDSRFFEGVMHVPLVMHWSNGFGTEGRRLNGLVEMTDIMPTLSELCGIPGHEYFQGRSYAKVLLGEEEFVPRDDVYAIHGASDVMLRSDKYKYILYWCSGKREEILFDLEKDPDETKNVASCPEYSDSLRAMRDRMLERTLDASKSIQPDIHKF